MMRLTTSVLAAVSLAASWAIGPAAAQDSEPVVAQVKTSDGTDAGTVTFEQVDKGVVITAQLKNLPEGPHAFHIHERGACESPDFKSAGDHYSPQGDAHGFDTPGGYHAGDLPNVYVTEDGTAKVDFFAPHLTLESDTARDDQPPFTLLDADGSAVMIHEDLDDYRAATPDSTGARIACGVIAAAAASE